MSAQSYEDLLLHVGHELECVTYGSARVEGHAAVMPANIAVECVTCSMVLLDFDAPAPEPLTGEHLREVGEPGVVTRDGLRIVNEDGPGTTIVMPAPEPEDANAGLESREVGEPGWVGLAPPEDPPCKRCGNPQSEHDDPTLACPAWTPEG